MKLPKKLNHQRKELINTQSIDNNEYFKRSIIRQLNPADCKLARITKADKDLAKKRNFKGIKFPVKIRDIHKIERKASIGISAFGYENKGKHPIYVSKNVLKKSILIYY